MLAHHITEVIFVGLPGPTHHYGGLSEDNVAAVANRGSQSSPKQAALQALELIRLLGKLGIKTAILPPQLRPHLPLLREHFTGSDDAIILQAATHAPHLLEKASSSSAMWTANAATVAPAIDTSDGKLHITPANLFTNLHRRIEAADTHRVLAAMFEGVPDCKIHPPLFAELRDEGAANHMRLSPSHSDKGLHIFVYGVDGKASDTDTARQDLAASQAIKAQHNIPDAEALFIKQNSDIIRLGVFHNDVIAVSNEHVLLAHEDAYAPQDFQRIADAYRALAGKELIILLIKRSELSVEEAVGTYIFNSQIVTKPDGTMAMIAPMEAKSGKAGQLLERLRADPANPINNIHYIDLRQSMRNGGGPACLRLRVPVTDAQLSVLEKKKTLADEVLLAALSKLVEKYYPDSLTPAELGKPALYHACKALLGEMGQLPQLPLLD
jgi:succinylarginine dihydrolase